MKTKVFIPESNANVELLYSYFSSKEDFEVTEAIKIDGSEEFERGVVLTANAWPFLSFTDTLKGCVVPVSFAENPRDFNSGKYLQFTTNDTFVAPKVNEAIKEMNEKSSEKFFVILDFQEEKQVATVSACSFGHSNADYWQKRIGEGLRGIGLNPAFHHVWIK